MSFNIQVKASSRKVQKVRGTVIVHKNCHSLILGVSKQLRKVGHQAWMFRLLHTYISSRLWANVCHNHFSEHIYAPFTSRQSAMPASSFPRYSVAVITRFVPYSNGAASLPSYNCDGWQLNPAVWPGRCIPCCYSQESEFSQDIADVKFSELGLIKLERNKNWKQPSTVQPPRPPSVVAAAQDFPFPSIIVRSSAASVEPRPPRL